jgi:hypothetical protein
MKRKLMYAAGFICLVLSFSSCEKTCKVCQENTYDANNKLITQGNDTEYCGVDLIAIEAKTSVTVGSVTTKWVCR